jgi:ABC-2 type transport system ATP-binding protein
MDYALIVDDLHKNYAGEHALRSVSLQVPRGAMFGLIGADGAGKTTLIRICATLIDADAGRAVVLERDAKTQLSSIRAQIGYMPQKFSLYEDLSVRENMIFFADIFGIAAHEREARIERLLGFSRLGPFQNRRAGHLSGGMKQKLALSCALVHTPQLLLLDEPTTGVDPLSRREFWTILRELQQQGITIVVSTPYMEEAGYCSELLILHKGEILRKGSPHQLYAEYPMTLYRITAQDIILHFAQSASPPVGIELLYPSRGALHAALVPNTLGSADVLERVQSVVPAATTIEQVAPEVEDIFFHALATWEKQRSRQEGRM